jgi:hypothetical protein
LQVFAAKTVALLRIAYIVMALGIGAAVTVAWMLHLWGGVEQALVTVPYGLDGPPPLGFSNYGNGPILAGAFLIIGFATVRIRSELLALVCWFLMAPIVVETLAVFPTSAGVG